MIAALVFASQAASPTPGPPERIVLTDCPRASGEEIVVCGDSGNPRLPLPGERERPAVPRQPSGDPRAGLDHAGTGVCASSQGGCASSVNLFALGAAAARAVGKALRRTPDTSGRIAIDLDAPPPSIAGRLSP